MQLMFYVSDGWPHQLEELVLKLLRFTDVSNATVPQIDYTEKLLIDYRWFDAKNITPRFEFGFGLSYTTFDYSYLNIQPSSKPLLSVGISLKKKASMVQDPVGLYDSVYTVTFNVKNVGGADGNEGKAIFFKKMVSILTSLHILQCHKCILDSLLLPENLLKY